MVANRWRSTDPRDEPRKRELWRYLARVISEPTSFVLFHYDGDTVWSQRREAKSLGQFEEARTRVTQALYGGKMPLSAEEVTRRLGRLIECVPFYSTEAWTYQATDHAIALCREKHRGADVEKFSEWRADRARLDDVPQPKAATCLHDKHNDELGKHVPVRDVVQAGRSLTWFVWKLHANRELEDALAAP